MFYYQLQVERIKTRTEFLARVMIKQLYRTFSDVILIKIQWLKFQESLWTSFQVDQEAYQPPQINRAISQGKWIYLSTIKYLSQNQETTPIYWAIMTQLRDKNLDKLTSHKWSHKERKWLKKY